MNPWLSPLFYLSLGLLLCWVGKRAHGWVFPRLKLDEELTRRDNLALAVPLGAYYLAILLALGGPLAAPSRGGFWAELLLSSGWGLSALALLLAGAWLSRRALFGRLDADGEIGRGNVSAGIVLAGAQIANGLVVLGALSGEGGGAASALAFWAYAQLWLSVAARALAGARYELGLQLPRDNRAAALACAGALIGAGNVLRLSLTGDFQDWSGAVGGATAYAAGGLALQFAVAELADRILLPGITIRSEIVVALKPNTGVGALLALFHIGASVLVGWCL